MARWPSPQPCLKFRCNKICSNSCTDQVQRIFSRLPGSARSPLALKKRGVALLPTPDSRLPTPDSRFPTPYSGLPTSSSVKEP
ncbi:MAG: hypothetical protein F6K26_06130 [Moorea sp. SIO2I5]|nr:hypothetical protein [Moorena sp. SIO2I5]